MAYPEVKYGNVDGVFEYPPPPPLDIELPEDPADKLISFPDTKVDITNTAIENTLGSREKVISSWKQHIRNYRSKILCVTLLALYTVYIVCSLLYDHDSAVFVCLLEVVFLIVLIIKVFKVDIWRPIILLHKKWLFHVTRPVRNKIRVIVTVVVSLIMAAFLVWDVWPDFHRFIPLGGMALFVIFTLVTSTAPKKISWMTVTWGILLQFGMGVVILRWPPGYAACKFLGDSVSQFLSYTDEGSKFVFGNKGYKLHPVIFVVLPTVIFFSAVVSILYYLGIMQFVIRAIAAVLRFVMQTTPIESFATAAHIFIGQVASSVVLKPFLNDLTSSELHAVLTSGFATVAGTVVAAYIEFGVPAEHVISASFMSAPAALAVSKIAFPETKIPKQNIGKNMELEIGKERNIMEAASVGAMGAIKLIANVIVNLVAFIALLSFLDATLSYFGSRVGYPELSFDFVCSYLFMPLAFVMGIPWSQCWVVGKLIGKKIVINEFLAFAELGGYIKTGEIQGISVVVSTYILCGFGSIAAMGINLGALSAAEPRKRQEFAKRMLRALVAGNVACFMTACVAGILYQDVSQLTHNSMTNTSEILNNVTNQFYNTTEIQMVTIGIRDP